MFSSFFSKDKPVDTVNNQLIKWFKTHGWKKSAFEVSRIDLFHQPAYYGKAIIAHQQRVIVRLSVFEIAEKCKVHFDVICYKRGNDVTLQHWRPFIGASGLLVPIPFLDGAKEKVHSYGDLNEAPYNIKHTHTDKLRQYIKTLVATSSVVSQNGFTI